MYSLLNAQYLPGYVILHDTNIREAYRVLSDQSLISKERFELEEAITLKSGSSQSSFLASVINKQLAVLAHSDYSASAVREVLQTDVPVHRAELALSTPLLPNYTRSEKKVIGLAGIIADVKGIGVIEAIANDPNFRSCKFMIFGFNHAPQETLDRLNSYENLELSTNLTDFEFQKSISKLDIFVNYRTKYQGETSLSTLEAMRQGVVVIVRDFGWYSELPDKAVVKAATEAGVIKSLQELLGDPDHLKDISQAATKYVEDCHSHKAYAEGVQTLIKADPGADNLTLVANLKSLGIKTPDAYISALKKLEG